MNARGPALMLSAFLLAGCGSQAQAPATVTVTATVTASAKASLSPAPTATPAPPTKFYVTMSSDSAIGQATAYVETQSRPALDWLLSQNGSNGYQVRQVNAIPAGLNMVCTANLSGNKGQVSAWADQDSAASTFLANIVCSG